MARLLGLGLLLVTLAACGGDDGGGPDPDAGPSGSGGSGGVGGTGGVGGNGGNGGMGGTGGAAPIECANHSDCDDGVYCNGTETCDASDANADPVTGCVAGTMVVCDDEIACTTDDCSETTDACTFVAPDADSDGHSDAACVDDQNDPLGDDCDDDDAMRFPGNPELCDLIDQDCDVSTFGTIDNDGDGSVDAACCNTDDNDVDHCGLDCDDNNIARHARQPEFCDGIDNDCDMAFDEVQNAVAWYRDLDMDGFGIPGSPIVSCTPQAGRSLVATDCDDSDPNVKPIASEICDDADNNCNGYVDESLSGCATSEDVTSIVINECLNGLDDCGNNATCEDARESFSCACAPGFTGDGITCTASDDCSIDNGGCDPLTTCTSSNGSATCGACPSNYVGTGSAGCVPTLMLLAVSPGVLTPTLSGETLAYGVEVALSVQTITLTPTVPPGATITIDGDTVVSGAAWQSPMLDLGGNVFDIVVSQVGHPSRSYEITVSRAQSQEAYFKGTNAVANDYFGTSVALSDDTLVVGAYGEDGVSSNNGAVYVFVRNGTNWTQQAVLKAGAPSSSDEFGWSVAVSGDTIVVGAPYEDSNAIGINGNEANNSTTSSGAAYVFVRSGTTWTQQAYLKAINTGSNDLFGYSVAVSGDTIVVGAYGEDGSATGVNGDWATNGATSSGAAYVFARSGVTWVQQAYLKASSSSTNDVFGYSVAVSGDTVVVGAYGDDSATADPANNSASNAGAAYVFTRSGVTWTQQAFLKASNIGVDDDFATAVAIAGDTIVVGSPGEDSSATGIDGNQGNNAISNSGAVYVFQRTGTAWTQQAYVKASNTGGSDAFGSAVAIDGDTFVIGVAFEDSTSTGVNGADTGNANASGAAYVFVRDAGAWAQRSYVKASNTTTDDRFGTSVAVSGDTVAVGAPNEDSNATGINGDQTNNSAANNGAVYVFR